MYQKYYWKITNCEAGGGGGGGVTLGQPGEKACLLQAAAGVLLFFSMCPNQAPTHSGETVSAT